MEHIITQIQERLSAKVPALKYIAQDWGQLDLYADFPPVKFPCALVDITDAQYSNVGNNVQEARLSITITVADLNNRISRNAPNDMQDRAMLIFGLMTAIHQALHGWSGDKDYAKLVRTSMGRQIRDDGARLRTINFTTTWWDQSADRRQATNVNDLQIN